MGKFQTHTFLYKNYMLFRKELGTLICNKVWGEPCLFSHNKFVKSYFLLTLLRKVKLFFFIEERRYLKELP